MRYLLLLCAALPVLGTTIARGADTTCPIPENARFYCRIDVDAMRSTDWLWANIQKVAASESIREPLAELPASLGFVRETQLHEIALLVLGETPNSQIVVVVRCDTNRDALAGVIQTSRGYARVHHGAHAIHHWLAEEHSLIPATDRLLFPEGRAAVDEASGEAPDVSPRYLAMHGDDRIIFATHLPAIIQALDCLDGTAATVDRERLYPVAGEGRRRVFEYHNLEWLRARDNGRPESAQAVEGKNRIKLDARAVVVVASADARFHLDVAVEAGSPMQAALLAMMVQPEPLAEQWAQFARFAAASGDGEKTVTGNLGAAPEREPVKKPNGRIMLGAELRGTDVDKDRAQVVEFLRRALRVRTDGNMLIGQWTSAAELTYRHETEDGLSSHKLTVRVADEGTGAATAAESTDTGQKVRR